MKFNHTHHRVHITHSNNSNLSHSQRRNSSSKNLALKERTQPLRHQVSLMLLLPLRLLQLQILLQQKQGDQMDRVAPHLREQQVEMDLRPGRK